MSNVRPMKVVSYDDLQKVVPNFEMKWLDNIKSDARVLLWNLGIDTDFGIEVQEGMVHRTKLCGVSNCPRMVGHERIDKEWLQGGYATDEAKEFTKDITLAAELNRLKNRPK